MQYVGIDLGADACSVSVIDEQGILMNYFEIGNNENGWKQLIDAVGKESVMAMEACTAAYPIHDYLQKNGYSVKVGHPAAIKAITHSKSKTDQKDSEILANLLRLNYLPLAYIPTPDTIATRDLLRARIHIGSEIRRVKNRIHAFLLKNNLRTRFNNKSDIFGKAGRKLITTIKLDSPRDCILLTSMTQLESLEKQKQILDSEIAKISLKNDDVLLLMTTPGLDFYSALIIYNEIGDINRFKDSSALCMYSGLVPGVWSSADVTRIGRMTKRGPPTLRWILTVVVGIIIRFENPIREFYRRIVRKKRSKKIAHVAAARKVLVMIYYMLKNREKCRWGIEQMSERKLAALRMACRRKVLKT